MEKAIFDFKGKSGSVPERRELVKFFVDNLRNKKGKPFSARQIAIKLSHLNVSELENFKGDCKDILLRKGQTPFQKYFWWSLKV